ncbi:hypothetical protein BHE74_00004728 [Ensete ventricosum]|nr:hypothetical protein GW17_00011610 [Ensete ventricosum]RWW86483.1 hypothetical protein BHE74_00004728 [Ensete ventricosum]
MASVFLSSSPAIVNPRVPSQKRRLLLSSFRLLASSASSSSSPSPSSKPEVIVTRERGKNAKLISSLVPLLPGYSRPSLVLLSPARFAISIFTAWYGRYIPVRQVAGTWTARYRAVPPKIDCRRSIEREKGKKKKKRKKKKKKRKEEKKDLSPARGPHPCAIAARGTSPPAGRQRPRAIAAR